MLIFHVLSSWTAYDNFVSNMKSSLGMEKQKNSLLSEELKIKKGAVDRLRSELENTKEQLEYMREEKGNNISMTIVQALILQLTYKALLYIVIPTSVSRLLVKSTNNMLNKYVQSYIHVIFKKNLYPM